MLRPAERFSVNIVRRDEYIGPQPSAFRPSPLTLVVLAAILGTGVGGVLPAAWGPASDRAGVTQARLGRGHLDVVDAGLGVADVFQQHRGADVVERLIPVGLGYLTQAAVVDAAVDLRLAVAIHRADQRLAVAGCARRTADDDAPGPPPEDSQ